MVGGLIVFILLLLDIGKLLLGGIISLYFSLALSMTLAFLYRPIKKLGMRYLFFGICTFFLIVAVSIMGFILL